MITQTLPWKNRIAILWASGLLLELAHLILISETHNWLVRHGNLVVYSSFFILAPIALVVLTLTLPDTPNRWVNIILGCFFAFVSAPLNFLECGVGLIQYTGPDPGLEQGLILGLKVIVTLLIPWFALKWPRQESE